MNLVEVEDHVVDFVVKIPDASSNEKARKVRLMLDFTLDYYTKHMISLDAKEVYEILFGEENE